MHQCYHPHHTHLFNRDTAEKEREREREREREMTDKKSPYLQVLEHKLEIVQNLLTSFTDVR